MLLGFFFLGIEELAIQLEEPFSVLPLSNIVRGVGLSAEEHVQWMEKTMQRKAATSPPRQPPNTKRRRFLPPWGSSQEPVDLPERPQSIAKE